MAQVNGSDRNIRVAIESTANVLITGATGTGKTRLAQIIHKESARRERPFIAINLAALHEGTIESELFGHERGAFTGADRKRKGLLEMANGGTVLLDEIGELPLRLQARLLEFLQSRKITPVGGSAPIALDVRVIAATHRNLKNAVESGLFREDLFHRLRVVEIALAPITKHWSEIDRIVHDCLSELSARSGRKVLRLSEEVAKLLEYHSWPGNFRELRNVLEYAVHAGTGPELKASDLPAWFVPQSAIQHVSAGNMLKSVCGSGDEVAAEDQKQRSSGEAYLPLDFRRSMAEFEKKFLAQSLKYCGGNVSLTARQIGVPKATLLRRLRQHDLTRRPALIPPACTNRRIEFGQDNQ